MRNLLLMFFVGLLLLCNGTGVFAKAESKGKENKEAKKQLRRGRADTNKPAMKNEQERLRERQRKREQMLERIKQRDKTREARRKVRQPKTAAEKKDVAKKRKAKGKEHQKQLQALNKQLGHEMEKHQKRMARLGRIRELSVEAGNTKTVGRVDKLMKKELQRFQRKNLRMQKKSQRVSEPGLKGPTKKAEKAVKKNAKVKTEAPDAEEKE